ncbi:hypothetical protein [Lactiplantibacillus plantarum]|uniref:hypothetical protein n=1 Tax=Lactiplantibacillus plantarum TaxID=1590 RepID=UPI002001A68E|nr:hypothetical protein [Lactiplantibacillus plantarum]
MSKVIETNPVLDAKPVKSTSTKSDRRNTSSKQQVYTNVQSAKTKHVKTYSQQSLPQLGLVNESSPLIIGGASLLGLTALCLLVSKLTHRNKRVKA